MFATFPRYIIENFELTPDESNWKFLDYTLICPAIYAYWVNLHLQITSDTKDGFHVRAIP